MNEEAIYILTKMICKNYEKNRGKYIKLTYEEWVGYTIKALKLIERCKNGKTI